MLVYIAYEERISCRGPLRAALYGKPILCFSNSTGWWRQYLVRHSAGATARVGVYVNISPFEEWLKISSKIIGNVASSYQVNLAIEIPNIAENYINSHVSLVDIGYLQCLFKYTPRCWEVLLIGQIFSNRESSELIFYWKKPINFI